MSAMIRFVTRRTFFGLGLAALASLAWVSATGPARAAEGSDRPFVVKVHADWCGTCVKLNPTWEQIESKMSDRAEIVIFDVTDKDSLTKSRATAEKLGLVEFFDANKSKTGTIAVLAADGSPVVVLKGETDYSPYEAALEEALAEQS